MKQHHYNVIPECYADTVLVEMLGFSRPNHAVNSNISYVLKTVRASLPNQQVVGIIDSDRGRSEKLLDSFKLIDEQHNIKKFSRGKQTILVICPAFESWIFQNAAKKNVDPTDHHFPTPIYFRRKCKDIHAKRNQDLKQFLNTLKQKQAPGFVQLKTWICEGAGIDENDFEPCEL